MDQQLLHFGNIIIENYYKSEIIIWQDGGRDFQESGTIFFRLYLISHFNACQNHLQYFVFGAHFTWFYNGIRLLEKVFLLLQPFVINLTPIPGCYIC